MFRLTISLWVIRSVYKKLTAEDSEESFPEGVHLTKIIIRDDSSWDTPIGNGVKE